MDNTSQGFFILILQFLKVNPTTEFLSSLQRTENLFLLTCTLCICKKTTAMFCMCLCSTFHLSCGELGPGRVILPCSRPGLGSALWKGAGSPSSPSPAYWWHYSLSENARLKATASRGLIAEPVLQLLWLTPQPWLLSALRTPLVKHMHFNESYLGIVCSFDEPLLEHLLLHHSSRPPGSTIFIHLLIS